MHRLARRAAQQFDTGARRHSGGCTRLRLAATFGAGERRAHRHDRADQSRGGQRANHFRVGRAPVLGESEQHAREHAGPAGRRRRDDYPHRRVDLLHGECGGERIGEYRPGERAAAHD